LASSAILGVRALTIPSRLPDQPHLKLSRVRFKAGKVSETYMSIWRWFSGEERFEAFLERRSSVNKVDVDR